MLSKFVKIVLVFGSLMSLSLYGESVYGFGSTDDSTSFSSPSVRPLKTMAAMRQRIIEQDERIDGLTTIIEGLSASLNELRSSRVNQAQANNSESSDTLLQKLAGMIDDINANYVRRDELDSVLGQKNKEVSKTKQTTHPKEKTSLSSKSKAKLYSEGVRHFVKKRYDEAKKRFTITDTKGYKPAASNYYLGEIAYYTKQYGDAIFYFKKSAGLYDKASYIDTLLLHTAISLHKTGEKSQARMFYENIIENYPNKKTATIAKDRLKKL